MPAVPELPFPLTSLHPGVWRRDEHRAAVIAEAPAHTDLYVDPADPDSTDAGSLPTAPTLLGTPPAGDFQFSARVRPEFRSQFDAGVLMLWTDERNWAKFCFEFSPAGEPMVVSVVTRGLSDDANAIAVPDHSVFLRVARVDASYVYHASADGTVWTLVRVFNLGGAPSDHRLGFEAQSPTGDGCRVTFDRIRFSRDRLADLRDGS